MTVDEIMKVIPNVVWTVPHRPVPPWWRDELYFGYLVEASLRHLRDKDCDRIDRKGQAWSNKRPIKFELALDQEGQPNGILFGNAKDRKRGMAAVGRAFSEWEAFVKTCDRLAKRDDVIVIDAALGPACGRADRMVMRRIRREPWYAGEFTHPLYRDSDIYIIVRADDAKAFNAQRDAFCKAEHEQHHEEKEHEA